MEAFVMSIIKGIQKFLGSDPEKKRERSRVLNYLPENVVDDMSYEELKAVPNFNWWLYYKFKQMKLSTKEVREAIVAVTTKKTEIDSRIESCDEYYLKERIMVAKVRVNVRGKPLYARYFKASLLSKLQDALFGMLEYRDKVYLRNLVEEFSETPARYGNHFGKDDLYEALTFSEWCEAVATEEHDEDCEKLSGEIKSALGIVSRNIKKRLKEDSYGFDKIYITVRGNPLFIGYLDEQGVYQVETVLEKKLKELKSELQKQTEPELTLEEELIQALGEIESNAGERVETNQTALRLWKKHIDKWTQQGLPEEEIIRREELYKVFARQIVSRRRNKSEVKDEL